MISAVGQALRERSAQALSNADSQAVDIPAEFPAEDAYSRSDDVPRFLLFASYRAGTWIEVREWAALSLRQQQYVQASLDSRGIMLFRRGGRLLTIRKELDGQPAEIVGVETPYEFGVDCVDHRITDANDVKFVVWNCSSQKEARQKLGRFLRELMQTGAKLV